MRPIGFSTGALAKGDFRRGIQLQLRNATLRAIELSALREHELPLLVESAESLDLRGFDYVSFHAPSKLQGVDEGAAVEMLLRLPPSWPVVVHPDVIQNYSLWAGLGWRLCIENMDNRKATGRTVAELREIFSILPEAGFCLDVGHAKQIDPTMATAILMLREFGERLRQIHVSDVGAKGEHYSIGVMARLAFSRVASHVPQNCPIIIESVIEAEDMDREVDAAGEAFDEEEGGWRLKPPSLVAV